MNLSYCQLRHASKTSGMLWAQMCFALQVQRLQRYATYGHLKQLVLRLIADDVVALSEEMSDKVMALRQAYLIPLQPTRSSKLPQNTDTPISSHRERLTNLIQRSSP